MTDKTFFCWHCLGIVDVIMAIAANRPRKMMHMTSRKLALQLHAILIVAFLAPIQGHFGRFWMILR
jgi:hypothetical protein